MEYRTLGRTGLKVSLIGLGTMTWGQQNTEAEGHEQMDYALDQGVNLFDAAELYSIPPKAETQGSTERIIGSWLKARKNRDKIVLASKVCGRNDFTWFRDDGSKCRLTKGQITEALHKSLARLGTDYLDLYQLHAPNRVMPWGSNPTRFIDAEFAVNADDDNFYEVLETLDGFVKAGKIRHIGLSNESAWGTMKFLFESEKSGLPRVATIQNAYNLVNRTYDTALAELSIREGVNLLAYSPLGQGFLTGKYLDGALPPGSRTTLFNRGQRYQRPGVDDAVRDYMAIAKEAGMDAATLAIAFVNSRSFVASNLIGATTMEQLKIAIATKDVKLSADVLDKIDAVHQLRGNPAP
ncbi:MAG: aldo/keto reductase [Rhizobiales bacterium PAR1]|nr:MAG: aldo/keto reductase [Rhizobiales bacterium PAR1]